MLSTSGWEIQGRLPGGSGIFQAFAEEMGFESMETVMGERRAVQCDGSTNGCGVWVEGGHDPFRVLLCPESRAAKGSRQHAACCRHCAVVSVCATCHCVCLRSVSSLVKSLHGTPVSQLVHTSQYTAGREGRPCSWFCENGLFLDRFVCHLQGAQGRPLLLEVLQGKGMAWLYEFHLFELGGAL